MDIFSQNVEKCGNVKSDLPEVSIIVPCRNEKNYIIPFLKSLFNQDYPSDKIEILIADGMSNDGTREILQSFVKDKQYIRLIDNPEKIVSTGLNRAIQAAKGEIIIRMDVHSEYAVDYIHQAVTALKKSKADVVGGPWVARGKNYTQKAIAIAFQSPFSCGSARSHRHNYEGPADTVYLGCWWKKSFSKFGLFDKKLVRNQDDELNLRILRRGGRIWQTPKIRSWYYPRDTLSGLFKQYYQYGYWKVFVIRKHGKPASWRHLVPGVFVLTSFLGFAGSLFFDSLRWIVTLPIALYALFLLFGSFVTARKTSWKYLFMLPLIFATFHLGYGLGFLHGLISCASGSAKSSRLTTHPSR